MEKTIPTSEISSRRTYVLLALNILGVIACVCLMITLTLWALGLILPEPNTALPILNHINMMKISNKTAWRVGSPINWNILSEDFDDY